MSKIDTSSNRNGAIADYFQSMGILPTGVSTLAPMIYVSWEAGLVPMLVGAAGSGKTDIIKQLCKAIGADLLHIFVAHVGSEEIKGLFFRNEDCDKTYKVLVNEEIHGAVKKATDTGTPLVIFLDELNRASDQDSLNAIFSMISKRGVPGMDFPSNVHFVAAGNPPTGKYSVAQMADDAFVRRLLWMGVTVDPASWLKYARGEKLEVSLPKPKKGFSLEELPLHSKVQSYIQARPEDLFSEEMANQGKPHPNPASWTRVSNVLKTLEAYKIKSPQVFKTLISGLIGDAICNGFYASYVDGRLHIPPEHILEGEWSKVEKRLRAIREENRHDLMGETIRAICFKIKLDRPEVTDQMASNLVSFLDQLTEDQQGTFSSLLGTSDVPENEKATYIQYKSLLTKEMQKDERFIKISTNLLDLQGAE